MKYITTKPKALTSSKLFKHQVKFVFLFKELHQLQDVTADKEKRYEQMVTITNHEFW